MIAAIAARFSSLAPVTDALEGENPTAIAARVALRSIRYSEINIACFGVSLLFMPSLLAIARGSKQLTLRAANLLTLLAALCPGGSTWNLQASITLRNGRKQRRAYSLLHPLRLALPLFRQASDRAAG